MSRTYIEEFGGGNFRPRCCSKVKADMGSSSGTTSTSAKTATLSGGKPEP